MGLNGLNQYRLCKNVLVQAAYPSQGKLTINIHVLKQLIKEIRLKVNTVMQGNYGNVSKQIKQLNESKKGKHYVQEEI